MPGAAPTGWKNTKLAELLTYEQPGKYLVTSSQQLQVGRVPVLTAGKTFVLGYTNDSHGVYTNHPVIIFDDFTTASKFVDFDFKAKSSAMKILSARPGVANIRFVFERMQLIDFPLGDHKRYWISEYSNLPVEVPDIADQNALAEVISNLAGQVASLERLVAKKQAIKQGMMQQLFTGPADWTDTAPLGSITSWLSGGTPNRSNLSYWSGTIPWISATTLRRLEVATSDQCVTPAAVRAGSKMAPLGSTLLLVRGSALHSEIRASLVTGPVCFNQDVKALVPSHRVVPKFLTYSIHGNTHKLLRLVTSAGNTAGVLDTQVGKRFEIWVPSRSEQQRIVTVLDDVSNDIDMLTARLSKAKAVKQGIMQELLTGRTRLPVKETVS